MTEESKPSSTGEEEEDTSSSPSSSPISYPNLLSDSQVVRNPQVVVPSIKKLPLSHNESEEEEEEERPHPRESKRLKKNCPKALDKIHPSDHDPPANNEDDSFSFFGFETRAYSPQFTPKFGSFAGGGEDPRGEPKERRA